MYKTCNIVMLPTKNKATKEELFIESNNQLDISCMNIGCRFNAQHLYITSDEEIKKNDWCYNSKRKSIGLGKYMIGTNEFIFCKKIIATTDTSLKLYDSEVLVSASGFSMNTDDINLPQPPQQFIQKYIEEYNKGNVITKVMVEYEVMDISTMTSDIKTYPNLNIETLKINSDNTINIKPIKDSWSREEVIELLNKFAYDVSGNGMLVTAQLKVNEFWIEENL